MEKDRVNFLGRDHKEPLLKQQMWVFLICDTHLKTKPENNTREAPQRIQRTREASREDALASTRQFLPQ